MMISMCLAVAVAQPRVEPVPLSDCSLIGIVAELEDHLNYIGEYFIVDKRFSIRQEQVPPKLIANARLNVANTSRILTQKQIDGARWTARHTTQETIRDVLVAQWHIVGRKITVAELGGRVAYLIENEEVKVLQAPGVAERFFDDQIDRWLLQTSASLGKRHHFVREMGINFFVDSVLRGVELVPVEGYDDRFDIVGEWRWDRGVMAATDGKSVILVTGAPLIGPSSAGTQQTATPAGEPHKCRFLERR